MNAVSFWRDVAPTDWQLGQVLLMFIFWLAERSSWRSWMVLRGIKVLAILARSRKLRGGDLRDFIAWNSRDRSVNNHYVSNLGSFAVDVDWNEGCCTAIGGRHVVERRLEPHIHRRLLLLTNIWLESRIEKVRHSMQGLM